MEIVDNCANSALSTIGPFVYKDMETSVLRVISEYDPTDLNSLRDVEYIHDAEAMVNLHAGDNTKWNNQICGNIVTTVTHDGKTAEFMQHNYVYLDAANGSHWVKLAPTLNDQVGDYTVIVTLKLEDYPSITKDVSLKIKVLPCEIKSVIDDTNDPFTLPYYMYSVVDSKNPLLIETKKYHFEPLCDYTHSYALEVTPAPKVNQTSDFYQMTSNSEIVSINTINLWNRGMYKFSVTLTLTDYASSLGPSSFNREFNVRLHDPCGDTTLEPSETETVHLHTIVGLDPKLVYTFDNYKDTVSKKEDQVLKDDVTNTFWNNLSMIVGLELCGRREYEIYKIVTNKVTGVKDSYLAGKG